MARYGGDYGWRPMRYGGEYRQWGAAPRYDQEFGYPGQRPGRFYDRDFSGYRSRDPGYDYGYGGTSRYDRGYPMDRYPDPRWDGAARMGSLDPWAEMRLMTRRPYPSPWRGSYAGQGFGFGQGRGQFIYK